MALAHHRGGAGEPLVLVHGLGSRREAWSPVLPWLESRHEVLAIDLPGFGASAPDGTGPTVQDLAARVERFFGEAGVERPHVAGNSLGGGIALELARRGAVRSATAVSPVGFWTERERAFCQSSLGSARALCRALRPALPAILATGAGRTAFLAQNFGRPWRVPADDALLAVDGLIGAPSFDAVSAAFTGHRFGEPEDLREVPVTIAWGDRDRLLLYRQAARAQRLLPWASHVTLRSCGHVPFWDDSEQVAQVLLAGAVS